ncbi:DUF1349 domain-containing protein [Aquimarina gracilis]|uniref:DUF1349 domain-containing protein n=1 Tax=Aquimarina gracilis TaxID=874422 RepID=A0ABU5ZXY5_9FLAO|nr:DUF1349 domain-containing protein [Aquimarina gracilis]MEB3346739.1 DUF1349 domain-containing protein [Aquimarina gracilis]
MKQMQWFNEPDTWELINDSSLSMYVTPNTDFWRRTHYGFTIDDGPFYYAQIGGEFELKVKITGAYKSRFDQMGAMIRVDEKTWIKTGVEYVNERINISAVVTHKNSDWSMVELQQKPDSVWLKVTRRLDAIEIEYSLNDKDYTLIRLAYFPDNIPVMAGITAASPDGNGFEALFEDFVIKHLPDKRRIEWLRQNS